MVSRHGAEVLEKGASSSTKGKQTFKGTGYRLGQSEEDTQGIFAFKKLHHHNISFKVESLFSHTRRTSTRTTQNRCAEIVEDRIQFR